MPDLNSRSSTKPAEGGFHARDLRLAGGISAGLVSAILVGGALLAPVADWKGLSSDRGGDGAGIVTLAETPRVRVVPPRPGDGPQAGPALPVPGSGPIAFGPLTVAGGDAGGGGTVPGAGAGGGNGPAFPGADTSPRAGAARGEDGAIADAAEDQL